MPDRNPLENERAGDQSGASVYESQNNRSVRVHRDYPWDTVHQARTDLLGYAVLDGGQITRYLPAKDADDTSLYCVRAEIRGRAYTGEFDRENPSDGLMQTANTYSFADIHAVYERLPYDVGLLVDGSESQLGQQPIISETERFAVCVDRGAVEFVTAHAGIFQWNYWGTAGSGGPRVRVLQPVNFGVPERVPYTDLEIILYQWPAAALPITAIRACLGRVNASELQLPKRPWPQPASKPETLQFLSYYPEQVYFPDGTLAVNIHYLMRERTLTDSAYSGPDPPGPKTGWNVFPAPDGTFLEVTRAADPTKGPYLTEDFLGLFQPEP
jgi:hypothetical protein